jgi:hypothetical protein
MCPWQDYGLAGEVDRAAIPILQQQDKMGDDRLTLFQGI